MTAIVAVILALEWTWLLLSAIATILGAVDLRDYQADLRALDFRRANGLTPILKLMARSKIDAQVAVFVICLILLALGVFSVAMPPVLIPGVFPTFRIVSVVGFNLVLATCVVFFWRSLRRRRNAATEYRDYRRDA